MVMCITETRFDVMTLLKARGGHLYFKVDIIRVKQLSKSTLNTYFSNCENIP